MSNWGDSRQSLVFPVLLGGLSSNNSGTTRDTNNRSCASLCLASKKKETVRISNTLIHDLISR